jgi:hypothetical protein
VPTPFQHLLYSQRVIHAPGLPARVSHALEAERGAFLLGSTAGDVQVITGQPRVETHFYRLSEPHDRSAAERFLLAYPELANPSLMQPAHAAFLSGYLVHLVWDEVWAEDIFIPFYRDGDHWPDRKSYFVHHNALRVYLDRGAYSDLQKREGLPSLLGGAVPEGWLPFVTDAALTQWRDWLIDQLLDPARIQTVEVFARRMHVPSDRLEEIVDEMARGTYADVQGLGDALARYEAMALAESTLTLLSYWSIGVDLGRSVRRKRFVPGGRSTGH